jgi:hypothetical protein
MLSELAANKETSRLEEARLGTPSLPGWSGHRGKRPAEIALSIIAEMRAVLDGRRGGMLRERRGSIHGGQGDGERVTPCPWSRPFERRWREGRRRMGGIPTVVESNPAGVGAVILAAGSSSRMGSPKQTLQYRGESLLRKRRSRRAGRGVPSRHRRDGRAQRVVEKGIGRAGRAGGVEYTLGDRDGVVSPGGRRGDWRMPVLMRSS